MPTLVQPIHGGTGILCTAWGPLTAWDVINQVKHLPERTGQSCAVTHWLVDLSGLTSFEVTSDELGQISEIDRRNAEMVGDAFVAIVAPRALHYGMPRMYAALMGARSWTTEVFRGLDEAEAWLDAVACTPQSA